MASSVAALSKTLESITLTKIRELEKQHSKYETKKNEVITGADQSTDQRIRITQLLKGVEDLYPGAAEENAVRNIRHWLSQSKYDVNVPDELVQSYEETLRSKLEVQSRRLGLGHLYARLVTEWMSASAGDAAAATSEEDSFELVDRQKERLKELCDKFEKVVFEPLETDEVEIDRYLIDLFQGEKGCKGAPTLEYLRKAIRSECHSMFSTKSPFDEDTLKWCINGLLAEDLLSDEKQAILRDFLDNSMVLKEMADILNLRFADIENWDWDAGEHGIPVLPRQQLNGKYRIWMDEDVLQAILIHYVGIQCCVSLKPPLKNVFLHSSQGIWKWHTGPEFTTKDKDRFQYYTGRSAPHSHIIKEERKKQYTRHFFTSQLPESVTSIGFGQYGSDDTSDTADSNGEKTKNIKQLLLQTVASEAILHKALDGEVAMIQTDMKWFATGLSHSTIFAVMRFFGYSEAVIEFYRKVLQAPLNVQSSPDSPSTGSPRIRRRGVPMAHAPEKLIGELVLFIMDLVVNQEDGMLLYRLHDDIWLCGKPEHCANAWGAMKRFANMMGLEFNMAKTGSVYLTDGEKQRDPKIAKMLPQGEVKVGHLQLDPNSGKWEIDQPQVEEHVKQLQKQLAGCKSVLQWVQTWNSCIGRFFGHTFGEPAFCFGIDHVDKILKTYQWMQEVLFTKGVDHPAGARTGVVDHIKGMIRERFGVFNVPDAFIYLPESLGGLGLRNPFIPLLEARQQLERKSPENIIQGFLEIELENYQDLKKTFEEYDSVEKRLSSVRLSSVFDRHDVKAVSKLISAEDLDTFFSFEEFTRFRDHTSLALARAYNSLREVPVARGPALDPDVLDAVEDIDGYSKDTKTREAQWALQMYGESLRRDYGGMRLVDDEFLPLGVLKAMRNKAVKWTMVL